MPGLAASTPFRLASFMAQAVDGGPTPEPTAIDGIFFMDASLHDSAGPTSDGSPVGDTVRTLLGVMETLTGLDSVYLTRVDADSNIQETIFARDTRRERPHHPRGSGGAMEGHVVLADHRGWRALHPARRRTLGRHERRAGTVDPYLPERASARRWRPADRHALRDQRPPPADHRRHAARDQRVRPPARPPDRIRAGAGQAGSGPRRGGR